MGKHHSQKPPTTAVVVVVVVAADFGFSAFKQELVLILLWVGEGNFYDLGV